jgi:hypothetical protein
MDHFFDVKHAEEYGVDGAIIIKHMIFWITNKANDNNCHDGRTWINKSIADFETDFPYWTRRQIERVLKHLRTRGVLIIGNYNRNAHDRTLWYAFSDEHLFLNK